MAKITRIKASDPGKRPDSASDAPKKTKKVKVVSDSTSSKKPLKSAKNEPKSIKEEKKPFILIRPLVYLGRYIRDSWREIRQVRWPSRRATWKLVFAIFVYTGLFIAIIVLLDTIFTWLFGLFIG